MYVVSCLELEAIERQKAEKALAKATPDYATNLGSLQTTTANMSTVGGAQARGSLTLPVAAAKKTQASSYLPTDMPRIATSTIQSAHSCDVTENY